MMTSQPLPPIAATRVNLYRRAGFIQVRHIPWLSGHFALCRFGLSETIFAMEGVDRHAAQVVSWATFASVSDRRPWD